MSEWDTQRVLAEFEAWVWVPGDAVAVETEHVHLFVRKSEAVVIRAEAADDEVTEDLVGQVRGLAAEHGATTVKWTVQPQAGPPDLAEVLRAFGATETDRGDILSFDLRAGQLDLAVPAGVDVRPARTVDDVRAAHRVRSAVWPEFDVPSEAEIEKEAEAAARGEPGGRFVAYYHGTPAGTAGYQLAGEVVRLWGGSVVPELRGKGIYRALVAARLAHAGERGGTLAITNARVGTSGPILRRMGFTLHGQSVEFRLPVPE